MIKSTLKLMLAMVLFASCSQTEKAPSGMAYKITHGKGNEKLIKNGQAFKYTLEYRLKSNDSILKQNEFPEFEQYDSLGFSEVKYNFPEIVGKLRKGDKVDFFISIDTLLKKGAISPNDPILKKGDIVIGKLVMLDVFANIELAKADFMKEQLKKKQKLAKPIKDYLTKNNITAKETPEGIFIVVKNIGDTSSKINESKEVMVNYKLYNLKGVVYQTTFNPTDPSIKPLSVRVGEGQVIPGWDIGLTYFGKGGSGTLYIPSYLGYGKSGKNNIKPDEDLIFDIEIVDVKNKEALPEQGNAMMDQLNEQMKNEVDAKSKNSTKKEKKSTKKPAPKATENKQ
jgi:FKBP-type peptidyl-prolyl cis-trans isomerase